MMDTRRFSLGTLALLLALATPAVAQQAAEATPGSAEPTVATALHTGAIDVTAVSTAMVAFDGRGRAVLDLRPDELLVLEDGEPVTVLELAPGLAPESRPASLVENPTTVAEARRAGSPPWRVVVYVSTGLAGHFVLPTLCRHTAAEAGRLTELGPVEVVLANPTPELVIEAGSRPEDLQAALERLASDARGVTAIERTRKSFLREFTPGVGFNARAFDEQSSPASFAARARTSVYRERTIIRGELDRMVAWLQGEPPTTRGLLLWLTGGFDLNPSDFYLPLMEQLDPGLADALRTEYAALSLDGDVARMVEVALTYGWTVLPVSASRDRLAYGAEIGGDGKVQHATGVGIGSLETQTGEFSQIAPDYPLQLVARGTGGELVATERQLERALDRARSAYQLTYQVDRPADGRLHDLEIRCSRPDVRIRSRASVASGSLRGVAATRGQRLLAGEPIEGPLEMSAEVRNITKAGNGVRMGDLGVTADLRELRPLLSAVDLGRMRVTVVVEIANRAPFVHHQEIDLDWDDTGEVWGFVAGIRWPKRAKRMAVVVEELVSATWGTTAIDLR